MKWLKKLLQFLMGVRIKLSASRSKMVNNLLSLLLSLLWKSIHALLTYILGDIAFHNTFGIVYIYWVSPWMNENKTVAVTENYKYTYTSLISFFFYLHSIFSHFNLIYELRHESARSKGNQKHRATLSLWCIHTLCI